MNKREGTDKDSRTEGRRADHGRPSRLEPIRELSGGREGTGRELGGLIPEPNEARLGLRSNHGRWLVSEALGCKPQSGPRSRRDNAAGVGCQACSPLVSCT